VGQRSIFWLEAHVTESGNLVEVNRLTAIGDTGCKLNQRSCLSGQIHNLGVNVDWDQVGTGSREGKCFLNLSCDFWEAVSAAPVVSVSPTIFWNAFKLELLG